MTSSIKERLEAIWWHDSKLVAVAFYREEEEERIKISVDLLNKKGALTPTEIIFKSCAYVEASVYLEAKRMCADDISGAVCNSSSEWKTAVSEPGPYDPIRGDRHLEEHLHFSISLCPPGGTIDILAKDFAVTPLSPASSSPAPQSPPA